MRENKKLQLCRNPQSPSQPTEQGETKNELWCVIQKMWVEQKWMPARLLVQASPDLRIVSPMQTVSISCLLKSHGLTVWKGRSPFSTSRKTYKNHQWILFPLFSPQTQLLTFYISCKSWCHARVPEKKNHKPQWTPLNPLHLHILQPWMHHNGQAEHGSEFRQASG